MLGLLIKTFLFLIFSTSAWAAAPVIFYSDLISGPNTGGQNNLGVFVTIWGNNFGASQGTSTVTVGGGLVNNYPTWTNTMICFQLGSLVATGNIVVTTSAGSFSSASSPTPFNFTVQSGNIYFVQPGAATNGSGAFTSPFNQMWYAYNILSAGDTVYVETGSVTDVANGCEGWHSILCMEKSGTSGSPMSWIVYPNNTVTLTADGGIDTGADGGGSDGDQMQYVFRSNGGSWVTVSKFNLISTNSSANGANPVVAGGNGWVVVGNTYHSRNSGNNGLIEIGSNNVRVLGNTDNASFNDAYNNESHSVYVNGPSNPFEIGWNTFIGDYNMGWMIDSYHNGPRIGTMHDNLIIDNSSSGPAKGILVDGCADLPTPDTESTLYTNVTEAYNNIIVNAGVANAGGAMQANCGTNYVYNNTIYGSGAETNGVLQFEPGFASSGGPGGGLPVDYVANNIVYPLTAGEPYISGGNGTNAPPNWTMFTVLTRNNYFGNGNGPTQDTNPINANPQFVSPSLTTSANLQLQSTSPAIAAGYNTNSVVVNDYNGSTRPNPPAVGAYEYVSGSCLSNGSTCSINSQCCSGLCLASQCVNPSSPSNISVGLIGETTETGKLIY